MSRTFRTTHKAGTFLLPALLVGSLGFVSKESDGHEL
jgi:hypothetical protein